MNFRTTSLTVEKTHGKHVYISRIVQLTYSTMTVGLGSLVIDGEIETAHNVPLPW